MIDLRARPFHLTDEDVLWVDRTLAGMDLEAKIGQLFCLLGMVPEEDAVRETLGKLKPGGMMFRPAPGAAVQRIHRFLQEHSDVPMLVAANLERGGNGIATDGTNFASPLQVAATDDEMQAYRLGVICGREGRAVGCNWTFSPVIDLDYNFQNPITNTRTLGSDPDRVLRLARAYMKGLHEHDIAVTIKHWPGDGVDGRDQHLLTSVNTLSCEDWDRTYGKVYRGMIDAGANSVMSAHIQLPAYSRRLLAGIRDEDILPASLARELNVDLLRDRLGFNGLLVTDACVMAGYTMLMPRERAVPYTIAAGNDIFLFAMDLDEDLAFMREGVRSGILSLERVDEAVRRILALKASLKLHRRKAEGTLVPDESALATLNCDEHRRWAVECADRAVTLVKDTQNLLPLTVEKHRRILLYVLGDVGGYMDEGEPSNQVFIERLRAAGFQVDKYDYARHQGANMWAALSQPVAHLKKHYDLVLYYASLKTASNQTVVRITWAQPLGFDVPKYISDVPTAFVSVDNPYHLQDVPRVRTFINGYTGSPEIAAAIVDKMLGKSPFKGISPVDPFCGYWDARL